jgi:hypothetical protein
MPYCRYNILNAMADIFSEVIGVESVTRSYKEANLTGYNEADLPLVEIQEPWETADVEATSMHQVMLLDVKLRIWFADWCEEPNVVYEGLLKAIRDTIGNNFNLNGTATACWVTEVTRVEGETPLYHFDITLRTKYWLNQKVN